MFSCQSSHIAFEFIYLGKSSLVESNKTIDSCFHIVFYMVFFKIYIYLYSLGFFLEHMVRDQSSFIFLQVAIHLFQNQLFKSASEAYWNEKPGLSYFCFPYVFESGSGISVLFFWSTLLFMLSTIPFLFFSDILWYNLVPCFCQSSIALCLSFLILLFIVYFSVKALEQNFWLQRKNF